MVMMDVTLVTEILKTDITKDFNALTITKRTNVIIDGVTYKGTLEKRTIPKKTRNESNELITNENFSSEIDTFTGVTNFTTTRLPV